MPQAPVIQTAAPTTLLSVNGYQLPTLEQVPPPGDDDFDINGCMDHANCLWNKWVNQLGHWNKNNLIAIATSLVTSLSCDVLSCILYHMEQYIHSTAMFIPDAASPNTTLLGPFSLFESHIVEVDGVKLWDPTGIYAPPPKEKIPRPPNAFILYRRDKHVQLKAKYPDMHNNEISVMVGTMWKSEATDVRLKYQKMSKNLKAEIMAAHPDYQYKPRRSHQIKRRATRIVRVENEQGDAEEANIHPEDLRDLRERFPRIMRIRRHDGGTTVFIRGPPHQPRLGSEILLPRWWPRTISTAPAALAVPAAHENENAPEQEPAIEEDIQLNTFFAIPDAEIDQIDTDVDAIMTTWNLAEYGTPF